MALVAKSGVVPINLKLFNLTGSTPNFAPDFVKIGWYNGRLVRTVCSVPERVVSKGSVMEGRYIYKWKQQ